MTFRNFIFTSLIAVGLAYSGINLKTKSFANRLYQEAQVSGEYLPESSKLDLDTINSECGNNMLEGLCISGVGLSGLIFRKKKKLKLH